MYNLQASLLLAFLATAQGQCSLTPIEGRTEGFSLLKIFYGIKLIHCIRNCYDDDKCAGFFHDGSQCQLLRENPSGNFSSKDDAGYMLRRVAEPSCKKTVKI
ncbi:hypothetical protein Y032_0019g3775 [Ancylostoma ceylanicum]|uniref:Apple domain-containing protein n=1 Tax=Ancylostoma ceylanicum TaxID=53326 RepID=A0A016V1M1_9BILA|nr:hypothetical protein Y032_0019g3775 [Ancylostoma ceylanicum]